MQNPSLLSKQIVIILFLLGAAISGWEAYISFRIGGFTSGKFYFFAAIFIFCVLMYFRKKKERFRKS